MQRKPEDKPQAPKSPVQPDTPEPEIDAPPRDQDAPEYYSKDQKPSVARPGQGGDGSL